jgi:hypothetical protein
MILETLKEMLVEYQRDFEANKKECIELMRAGKPWEEKAKEGAGLKLMVEATILEMKKYTKN